MLRWRYSRLNLIDYNNLKPVISKNMGLWEASRRCVLLFPLLCTGCCYFMPPPPLPCGFTPPIENARLTKTYSCTGPTRAAVIPEMFQTLALVDLVDLSLQNSPKTRSAWFFAKQAAADVGTARGAYLPPLDLRGYWIRSELAKVNFGIENVDRATTSGIALSTAYLLFDFGGRNGTLMAALAALDYASWLYCLEIQQVMLFTIQSYYNYIYADALVTADLANVEDLTTTFEAARARRLSGVATVSDELQAQTALLQGQILLEQDGLAAEIAYATLIRALGLPADTPLCICGLPEQILPEGVCNDMAYVMQAAKERRTDLMAARASVLQQRFLIRSARSALLPTLDTSMLGTKESVNDSPFLNSFLVQFNVNVPLFRSFADINALRKAQAALLQAQAELDDAELNAFLSVVSDYYELLAGGKILNYSYKYLESALENRKAAFANYQAGVTTIIDLMTADTALQLARKQMAQAKIDFLSSLANLAYDTGSLTSDDVFHFAGCFPPWLREGWTQEKVWPE